MGETVFFPAVECLPCFYKEMIKCYNKAFVNDKDTFVKNILTQPLWGNKFITGYARTKQNVFLRNWVISGILTVGYLLFRNGILDEHHVYQTLIYKQNMYTEVALVKKVLLPYKQFLQQENILATNIVTLKRSRDFYMEFKRQLFAGNVIKAKLLSDCVEEDEVLAFSAKLVQEMEIKLKEFNFKLLHNILPCNKNLAKWRIKSNNSCDVCGQSQTVEHLLYNCIYVKPLWRVTEKKLGVDISFERMLGLDVFFAHNAIVTLIGFLIYKEWLLYSLAGKHRRSCIDLTWYKNELTRSTQRAQTSLAEADHYSHIVHCKNVEPWL